MKNITVRFANENACLILMQNNVMIDCLFINKYFYDSLSIDTIIMLANLYKETYNATLCLVTAKQKTEQTIDKLQSNLLTVECLVSRKVFHGY